MKEWYLTIVINADLRYNLSVKKFDCHVYKYKGVDLDVRFKHRSDRRRSLRSESCGSCQKMQPPCAGNLDRTRS